MNQKKVVRLNIKTLQEEQDRLNLSDNETAVLIGVSNTQLWRAKLDINDPRHNSPGGAFIAGVLSSFKAPFEKFFYLDSVLRVRSKNRTA